MNFWIYWQVRHSVFIAHDWVLHFLQNEVSKVMTDQELFDKVVAHLRKQNAKAVNDASFCKYRAPDGKRCAAGCLILDEHYNPNLEGNTVWHAGVRLALIKSGVNDDQIALVQDLQNVHDSMLVDQWEEEFVRVARVHNLTPPAAP